METARKWYVIGGKEEDATLVFAFAVRRVKKEAHYIDKNIEQCGIIFENSLAETKNTQRGKLMYDLGCFLDSGGYAQVYEAREHKSKERVAIKVIENNKKMSISDLNNEITLHWKMNHRNIVPLLDYFKDVINTYLVMPLCLGGDVFKLIEKEEHIPVETSISITQQAALAVEYCHHNMCLLCDVKIENLLIEQGNRNNDNGEIVVKMCDFGFAKTYDTTRVPRVKIYESVGTIIHWAYEQVSTKTGYDEKIDCWCLGFVLFEMLTRSPFFRGERWESVYEGFSSGNVSALRREMINLNMEKCPIDLRDRLIHLLELLFSSDPVVRPSASEIVYALSEII